MNDDPTQDTLELEVANFGPIVKAKIELRPLTVFIGPSNTGKSYLAILIYALQRYFSERHWSHNYRMFGDDRKIPKKTSAVLAKWAQQTFADKDELQAEKGIVLTTPVVDVIRSGFNSIGGSLNSEIKRCFGISDNDALIRKGDNDDACISFRKRFSEDFPFVEHGLTIKPQEIEFTATIPKGLSIPINVGKVDHPPIGYLRSLVERAISKDNQGAEGRNFTAWQLMEVLASFALPSLVGPLRFPAFYLPADRTGVMHAHSVVVSAMIGSAPMTGLRPATRTPMLSGVLADFLRQLIELDRPPYRRRPPRRDRSKKIEKSILGGSVHIDRSEAIDYPRFTYQPEGWKKGLPLMNASSMVSELAPVVLYLRHMVVPGNVLIVEEPESHLHPAMQVEFTRQLAALVRSGIRVIVTTHSEWVLEELANIVRRSKLPKGLRKESALRDDQVGAWLFQPRRRPKGSMVTEIGLDESGVYQSGFDDVAVALHNDWAEISNQVGEIE